ncbi:cell growth regulator with EF hand domain protein 1 [Sardina pilchardus]|uniref:cell growth regulator with EF hand domain protein 1 n=1 Tax=Sardina pilchardus TaxID=27697 RepID=UPI002E15D720
MFAAAVFPLLLAPLLIQGAPQQGQESQRSESTGDNVPLTLVNPFGSADESRSLLQSYIKANLNEQANPDVSTREQEVFFLFSLHDYDKSGQLDGLELMKLLSDFLSHLSQTPKSTDGVVAMVDYLLQTQDQNQDGLLAPSELLSPPIQASKLEPIPGADPAVESDSAGGARDEPKEEASPQQGDPVGEQAQEAQADGPSDSANEQELPQEEGEHQVQPPEEERGVQGEGQVPEGQHVDNLGDAGGKEPAQEEQAEAEAAQEQQQQQQQQAEEQRLESNVVENHPNHAPVHQGQPEM